MLAAEGVKYYLIYPRQSFKYVIPCGCVKGK